MELSLWFLLWASMICWFELYLGLFLAQTKGINLWAAKWIKSLCCNDFWQSKAVMKSFRLDRGWLFFITNVELAVNLKLCLNSDTLAKLSHCCKANLLCWNTFLLFWSWLDCCVQEEDILDSVCLSKNLAKACDRSIFGQFYFSCRLTKSSIHFFLEARSVT